MLKKILKCIVQKCFRVQVHGLENYKKAAPSTLIVVNHLSFLDGVLLALFLPDETIFAVNSHIATRWYFKPFFRLINLFTLDPMNPIAVKSIIQEIKQDKKCIIFPEGRITSTGALMKIYEGTGLIADKTNADILPIHINGAQYSYFSRLKGKVRRRIFPKISLHIFEPHKLYLSEEIKGKARRKKSAERLHEIMANAAFSSADIHKTLFNALIHAQKLHGRNHDIIEDPKRIALSYGQVMARSFILGKALSLHTQKEETIGLLLPTMNVGVITFFALHAYHRIPAILNYSSGIKNLCSTCDTAAIKTVITSKTFIEKGKLEKQIQALADNQITIIYLEDLAQCISLFDKFKGFLASYFPNFIYQYHCPQNQSNLEEQTAVILFTSGSEGRPKGVALSHKNIQANREQAAAGLDFSPQDKVFNCLPIFHSFGLTIGTMLPILSGMKVFLYPSPLHYRIIPELIYDFEATILLSTDTFLSGYSRFAHSYDFHTLRYIFAGAEKLKEETRQLWSTKYGIRIFEAYGTTEAAPGVAFNTPMYNQPNTVGKLLPGIQARLEKVEGIQNGGRLIISGPNLMKGYLRHEQPGKIIPLDNNEYDTGDIVHIDQNQFITIQGRAKRFAKIGGEMLSLLAIEECFYQLWPTFNHAVINIPDTKKGEALILITTNAKAELKAIKTHFQSQGFSELAIPKEIRLIKDFPLLGSGKIDYQTLQQQISENAL